MDYRVRHRTTYRYAQDVSYSHHLLHLVPRDTATQQVQESTLVVTPTTAYRVRRPDFFGNETEWLALNEPHAAIDFVAQSRVSAFDPPVRDPEASERWEDVRANLEAADIRPSDIVQYIFDSALTAFTVDLPTYASESFTPGRPLLAAAMDLMSRIHADFRYDKTVSDASTPVDRVFEMRAGVCQDLAHVAIAMMRSLGLPARYVSGYLMTRPPPGKARLVGADASHAWFSVWAPPFGWVDLDPTNNVIPGEEHIIVAWGRDYWDVAPVNGIVIGGADHLIEVAVDVVAAD
jgi:transglutaminase-like putative cysteine protease